MIVGIDTSTPATAVALLDPRSDEGIELRDDPAAGERPGHAQRLQPLLEQALVDAGATCEQVTRICVGVGPGGFTGLRLGIATARALAQGRELPLVGVSSLAALARNADEPGRLVLALIDARRGELFAAGYRDGGEILAPAALEPKLLLARVSAGALGLGDGAVRFRAELEQAGVVVPADDSVAHRVSALQVCRLGVAKEPTDRDALLPDYCREPDAVPPKLP
jgi:tRNA threonylcarbamoyladenosine biosynthesis protein TsaB